MVSSVIFGHSLVGCWLCVALPRDYINVNSVYHRL